MFQRRTPRSILQNVKELFWPSMGWMRAIKYTRLRLIRLSDSSHNIALGLSIGVAISFTPLLGTHFIQAGLICYAVRANFISSLIGTFAGNPWTFPFMWWAGISLGSYLFNLFGLPAESALPDDITLGIVWDLIKNDPFRIFAPWFVGGYLLGLMSIAVTYLPFYHMVNGAKIARKKARERGIHRAAKDVTGQVK